MKYAISFSTRRCCEGAAGKKAARPSSEGESRLEEEGRKEDSLLRLATQEQNRLGYLM
jgi:hypothetical protein